MAGSRKNKPVSGGPGRGTPRSRTAARPGQRSATRKARPHTVTRDEAKAKPEPSQATKSVQAQSKAVSVTWRLLVLGVLVAAIAVTLAQSLRAYFTQAHEIAMVREEIVAYHEEIESLEDQINRWNDPDYIKTMARERLGWVMPGETGYRVIGSDGEALGGEDDVLHPDEQVGDLWWQRMMGSVAAADQPVEDEEGSAVEEPADPTEPSPSPSEEETP